MNRNMKKENNIYKLPEKEQGKYPQKTKTYLRGKNKLKHYRLRAPKNILTIFMI